MFSVFKIGIKINTFGRSDFPEEIVQDRQEDVVIGRL